MESVDNRLPEVEEVLTDGRGETLPTHVATFEQLLAEHSELELTETLATVCGVHTAEFRVYLTVLDHPSSTIADIADILDRDQSTIGKQVKPLREQGLVERYPRTVDNGGVKYLYEAQSLPETKQWIQHELDTWTDAILSQLTRLHVK